MTKADKYLKDGVDINQMLDDYCKTGQKCPTVWKWLEQEDKPILLEVEKVILKELPIGEFEIIGRDCDENTLYLVKKYGLRQIW